MFSAAEVILWCFWSTWKFPQQLSMEIS